MTAKMRKQNLCIFIFQKLFIIAVTNDTADCFVKGCLMLRLSETVKKDKISISVHNSITMNIKQLLSFFFHKECFFDEIQHRNLAFSSRSFRGIDIKIATTLTTISSKIDKSLIPSITLAPEHIGHFSPFERALTLVSHSCPQAPFHHTLLFEPKVILSGVSGKFFSDHSGISSG